MNKANSDLALTQHLRRTIRTPDSLRLDMRGRLAAWDVRPGRASLARTTRDAGTSKRGGKLPAPRKPSLILRPSNLSLSMPLSSQPPLLDCSGMKVLINQQFNESNC